MDDGHYSYEDYEEAFYEDNYGSFPSITRLNNNYYHDWVEYSRVVTSTNEANLVEWKDGVQSWVPKSLIKGIRKYEMLLWSGYTRTPIKKELENVTVPLEYLEAVIEGAEVLSDYLERDGGSGGRYYNAAKFLRERIHSEYNDV